LLLFNAAQADLPFFPFIWNTPNKSATPINPLIDLKKS